MVLNLNNVILYRVTLHFRISSDMSKKMPGAIIDVVLAISKVVG
jgi:hypothetical protein